MGSFTGVTGDLVDRCACITQSCIKKFAGKVELNFPSAEIVVSYSQEAKYV